MKGNVKVQKRQKKMTEKKSERHQAVLIKLKKWDKTVNKTKKLLEKFEKSYC